MNRLALLCVALLLCVSPCLAEDMEITPFRTTNQSPLVQHFGIPAESSATVTPARRLTLHLAQDVASIYTVTATAREQIYLDGESYRWTLAARYGIAPRFEVGIDFPYVLYGGGFLDQFIINWHNAFGLPQGGRDSAPKNRFAFAYSKDGVQKLRVTRADSGPGDLSLSGGFQLYDQRDQQSHDSLAVRAALKLPTGDSATLQGSGSTDLSLSLCGSMNNFTEWGSLGVYGSLGGLVMTRGDILPDQQNRAAAFGTAGLGWGPAEWISFKVQFTAHTPLYHGSSLDELSKSTLMLVSGGALRLPGRYLLDIGVSEDLTVATSPDVAFHLGLSKQF